MFVIICEKRKVIEAIFKNIHSVFYTQRPFPHNLHSITRNLYENFP